MDIRRISVGPDYKNAMHFSKGKEAFGGHVIHEILFIEDGYNVFLKNKNEEIFQWKRIVGMPILIEYNIEFEITEELYSKTEGG
jgi:hypothetical protein